MKLKDLFEMTHVDNAISYKIMLSFFDNHEDDILNGNHVGDVEEYKILRCRVDGKDIFALVKDDTYYSAIRGYFNHNINIDKSLYVDMMITKSEFGGKSLNAKLIRFLLSREGWNVIIDSLISPANKQNFYKLAPVFHLKWLNVKTLEIVDFDDNPEEKFNNHYPTDWQILFPRFHIEKFNEEKMINYYTKFWTQKPYLPSDVIMISGYSYLDEFQLM